MEQYRTEEEQVEALKKWWQENGRSTVVAIVVALGIGFGWQGWKNYEQQTTEAASNSYQSMLQQLGAAEAGGDTGPIIKLGEDIKQEYPRSTYAQFAALHIARIAVNNSDLAKAEAELRWVLGRADKGSDTQQLAQLRLARVLASKGDQEQALSILESANAGTYQAAYAVAKGDTLLMMGRQEEAKVAYSSAMVLASRGGAQVNLGMLQQKIQSLSPVEPQTIQSGTVVPVSTGADTPVESAVQEE